MRPIGNAEGRPSMLHRIPACKLAGAWQNIRERTVRRRSEQVPDLPKRFHLLTPEVKCPACGAGLTFVRARGYGDLYQCASDGPCKCHILHYRNKAAKTCGWAVLYTFGALGVGPFGGWTACKAPAAKEK